MASDGARLLARGATIKLGEQEYQLRYDFESIVLIEEREGSLLGFLEELGKGWRGKQFRCLRTGLVAGLAHTGLSEREIVPLIDHRNLEAMRSYTDAINEAINEALPQNKDEASASGKASRKAKDSTGSSSTDSSPSTLAVVTASSGE